jgi:hypothetical protein
MFHKMMISLSINDKLILMQHAIDKYDSESVLKEKLKGTLSQKEIERTIDTLIGTQKVRRIGADVLQNNVTHTGELPELPGHLKSILESL